MAMGNGGLMDDEIMAHGLLSVFTQMQLGIFEWVFA